jgi:hypothetical protein
MSDSEAVQRGETWCSSHAWECRRRLVRVEVPAVPSGGRRPADEREVVEAGDAWCRSRDWICVLQDVHG